MESLSFPKGKKKYATFFVILGKIKQFKTLNKNGIHSVLKYYKKSHFLGNELYLFKEKINAKNCLKTD